MPARFIGPSVALVLWPCGVTSRIVLLEAVGCFGKIMTVSIVPLLLCFAFAFEPEHVVTVGGALAVEGQGRA